jgi:hypothetical protein
MKKYLLGIFAVILAIGFSAFTTKKNKNADNTYYFYTVVNGEIPSGASVMFGGPVTLAAADIADNCEGSNTHCLRGFVSPPALPTSSNGAVQTWKN